MSLRSGPCPESSHHWIARWNARERPVQDNRAPPKVSQYRWECKHLLLKQGVLYRWARPWESEEALLQLVLPAAQREVALRGYHNEVGHLGLEHMLNFMCDRLFWSHMAAQAKEHIRKCHLCLAFKARQAIAPLENIVATYPLELVHLDYLCLEPGKGLDENVHQVCSCIYNQHPNFPNDC